MADRYLIETSATDGYLLEDGSGVLLLEVSGGGSTDVFIDGLHRIGQGVVAITAAGLGGVLIT
jgi:hypothetical protein